MIIVYTIGFTKKSAKEFFEALKTRSIEILIDTRINNVSQLAGFAKSDDLQYFLQEICHIKYAYRPDFAPTRELLKNWREKRITWDEYEKQYLDIIEQRGTYKSFVEDYSQYEKVCILCSEATPEHCHRRLLAERLEKEFPTEIKVIHI